MSSNSICERWEGRTVDGKFPLLEWLGGWADQCVFLTVRQAMQTANIKLIFAAGQDGEAYEAKWEAARTLPHPYLVKVMESGHCAVEGKELVYVVTERAEAVLSGIIPRKALDAATVKAILQPIVEALSFVHEKGFVHGRVKPPNIVRVGEQWKLSVEELIAADEVQRPTGESGAYDAPEVANGNYSPASDVWSLGIIVIEAFTQRIPDAGPNGSRTVPESLPEPFFEIARRCIRRDPAERCSIADVKAILERYEPQPMAATSRPIRPDVEAPTLPVEPVEAEPARKPKQERASAPPALPFEESEPIELTPRSRLFASMEEEEESKSRLVPILFGIVILVGAAAVIGVREYRIKSFRLGDVLNLPTSSNSAQTKTPSTPQSQTQSTAPAPAPPTGGAQNQGAAGPNDTQNAPASNPAASQSQAPAQPGQTTPSAPPANTAGASPNASPGTSPSANSTTSPGAGPGTSPAASAPAPQSTPSSAQPSEASAAAPPRAPRAQQREPQQEAPRPQTHAAAYSDGAVLKRVLPNVAPGARESMQRPIEVELRLSVNERGTVSNAAYMTQGPGNYFARVSRDAARSWKFTPPERQGHPVPSVWTLRFRFDRRNTQASAIEIR